MEGKVARMGKLDRERMVLPRRLAGDMRDR